jgi:hypothetical protein
LTGFDQNRTCIKLKSAIAAKDAGYTLLAKSCVLHTQPIPTFETTTISTTIQTNYSSMWFGRHTPIRKNPIRGHPRDWALSEL